MIQRVVNFFYRRRRGFLYSAGLVAILYYALSYLKSKLLNYRSKANQSRIAKENLKKRFEQNQEDCLFTIATFLPHLSRQCLEIYDVESIISKLGQMRKGSTSPMTNSTGSLPGEESNTAEDPQKLAPEKSKVELWNEIKQLSFIRNFVAIHILSLISIFIHIQINMVGRLIYIESVIGESNEDVDQHNTSTPSNVSFETQKQYLSFSWWFVNRGWKSIGIKIQDILARELESISIRERLTYQQLWEIINQLRNKLEYEVFDQKHVILEALMPSDLAGEREVISQLEGRPVPDDYEINPNLRRLLDETKDFIECQDFDIVRLKVVDTLFSIFDTEVRNNIFNSQLSSENGEENIDMSLPLPKILPTLSKLLGPILEQHYNLYLKEVSKLKGLQAFSAIIYSSFQYYED